MASELFMEFFDGNVVRLESVVSGKCLRIGVDGSVDVRASERDHKALFVVDNKGDTDPATFRLQSKAKPGLWLACLETNTNNGAGRAVFTKGLGSTYKDGGREPRCEFRATNVRPGVFFIEGLNRFIGATEDGDVCPPEDAVDPKHPGMFIATVVDGLFAPGKILQFKNKLRADASPSNNLLRLRDIQHITPNGKVAGNVKPPPPKVDCNGTADEETTKFRIMNSSDSVVNDNYMDTFRRVAKGGKKDAEGGAVRLQSLANPNNFLAINPAHGVVCGTGGKDCYFVVEITDSGYFCLVQQGGNGRLGFVAKTGVPKVAHTVQMGPEAYFSAESLSNE